MGNTSDFWVMKIDDVVRFTFTLPYTATEWLLLCPLTQTFPQKRGRKPFTPFYLLSSHPPSVPWEVALGQKRVAHLSLPLPPPNFTQLHTHTDWNIGAHTNRTHPVNSCTRGDKLGSLSTKRGWGTPTLHTHTHTEPSSSIVGRFPCIPDNAHCSQHLRREICCCLCGR